MTRWLGKASREVVWCTSKAVCEPSPQTLVLWEGQLVIIAETGGECHVLTYRLFPEIPKPFSNLYNLSTFPQLGLKHPQLWRRAQGTALHSYIHQRFIQSTTQGLPTMFQMLCLSFLESRSQDKGFIALFHPPFYISLTRGQVSRQLRLPA